MTRRQFTLRSSHLLMWSSPLLLLVLVFTLNSRPLHRSTTSATSTTSTTATTPRSSTTTTTPSTTATSPPVVTTTSPPAGTTTTTATVALTTTTRAPTRSADSTTTSVAASGPVAQRNYDGWLSLASPAALVPLHGPGQWALHATHAVVSTLQCGSRSAALTNFVRITRTQTCTLDITINTGAATQWTLRATQ